MDEELPFGKRDDPSSFQIVFKGPIPGGEQDHSEALFNQHGREDLLLTFNLNEEEIRNTIAPDLPPDYEFRISEVSFAEGVSGPGWALEFLKYTMEAVWTVAAFITIYDFMQPRIKRAIRYAAKKRYKGKPILSASLVEALAVGKVMRWRRHKNRYTVSEFRLVESELDVGASYKEDHVYMLRIAKDALSNKEKMYVVFIDCHGRILTIAKYKV